LGQQKKEGPAKANVSSIIYTKSQLGNKKTQDIKRIVERTLSAGLKFCTFRNFTSIGIPND